MSLRDATKLRAAALRQEVHRSPILDLREMSKMNGRLFPADVRPIAADIAPLVPQLNNAVDLTGKKVLDLNAKFKSHSVTVMALNMSNLGASYLLPYKEAIPVGVQLIDVHVIVGTLKAILLSRLSRWQLNKTTKEEHRASTYCLNLAKPGLFGNLGAWNRYGGFVYLVDKQGRARWRASGPPIDHDLAHFKAAIEELRLISVL